DDDNLIFEKLAIGILGMPHIRIGNFPNRIRLISISHAKSDQVILEIVRYLIRPPELLHRPGHQRNVPPFFLRRFLTRKLPIRGEKSHRSQHPVLLINPIIPVANPIIVLRRRRNEIGIWRDKLVAIFEVEKFADDDAISITIERRTENLIPFVWPTEKHVEDDKPCT